jgi:hypothetical protein
MRECEANTDGLDSRTLEGVELAGSFAGFRKHYELVMWLAGKTWSSVWMIECGFDAASHRLL